MTTAKGGPTDPPDVGAWADIERFEGATAPALPEGFEERLLARLSSTAEARDEATLEATAEALRSSPVAAGAARVRRSPLREPVTWLFGLGLAAAAALTTFALLPAAPAPGEAPYTFAHGDGASRALPATVELDAQGRLAVINPAGHTGERVIFRSGRVIRIEHLRDGELDGVAVDFDADGGVVAIRTWVAGEERGPWLELDGHGVITKQGTR